MDSGQFKFNSDYFLDYPKLRQRLLFNELFLFCSYLFVDVSFLGEIAAHFQRVPQWCFLSGVLLNGVFYSPNMFPCTVCALLEKVRVK